MRRVGHSRFSSFAVGLATLAVIAIGTYFGFTKSNPLASHFEVKAAFRDAQNLKAKAPVRIAGVNVGKVTAVEKLPGSETGALVTLRIEDRGLPLHRDATLKVRPRIFLEGNSFLDVEPGSPSAPALDDGDTIPVTQTAAPVGLGQVLEALQHDTRESLQTVLDEYGRGLAGAGGRGYNRSIPYWEPAFRDSAIVNDATRGVLEHDLSQYIEHAGTVAGALDRDPAALKGLISDFATTAGAFAQEQSSLRTAIALLPQALSTGRRALGELNGAFPPLRRLVAELRPAVRASGPSLDATLPFVKQARGLFSARELGGLTKELKAVVPDLAELNRGGVGFQQQARLLSSCQLNSVIPTAETTIDDGHFKPSGPVYQEGVKWLPGIAGESRSFDANGQYIKTSARAGFNLAYAVGDGRFFLTSQPIQGVNPPKRQSETPLRPDVPCETQEPPDLRSVAAAPPPAIKIRQSGAAYDQRLAKAQTKAVSWLRGQLKREGLSGTLKVLARGLTADQLPLLRNQATKARKAGR